MLKHPKHISCKGFIEYIPDPVFGKDLTFKAFNGIGFNHMAEFLIAKLFSIDANPENPCGVFEVVHLKLH